MEDWAFWVMVGGALIVVASGYMLFDGLSKSHQFAIFALITFFLGAVLFGFSAGWGSAREMDAHDLLDRVGEQEELAFVAVVNANDFCVVLPRERDLFCAESRRVLNLADYGSGKGLNSIEAKPGDEFYVSKTKYTGEDMVLLTWVRR